MLKVIIVTNPDIFSTEGMTTFIKKYIEVRNLFNNDLQVAGILINGHNGRTNFSKDMIEVIRAGWGKVRIFNTIIPYSIKVQESQAAETTIKKYMPKNPAAIAFESFADEYLNSF